MSLEIKRSEYNSRTWSIIALREHAKSLGIKVPSKDSKATIAEKILEVEFADNYTETPAPRATASKVINTKIPTVPKSNLPPKETKSSLPPKETPASKETSKVLPPKKGIPAKKTPLASKETPVKKETPEHEEESVEEETPASKETFASKETPEHEEEFVEKETPGSKETSKVLPPKKGIPAKTVPAKKETIPVKKETPAPKKVPIVVEEEEDLEDEEKPIKKTLLPNKISSPQQASKSPSKKTCMGVTKKIRGLPGKPCPATVSAKFENKFCVVHSDQYKEYLKNKVDPILTMNDLQICEAMKCFIIIDHPEFLVEIRDQAIPLYETNISLKNIFIDDCASIDVTDEQIKIAKELGINTDKIEELRDAYHASMSNLKGTDRT